MHTSLASSQAAAGTVYSVWQSRNTSSAPCSSYGYPGMDFLSPGGWLGVHVIRGSLPGVSGSPHRIVVPSGRYLYFESSWGEVTPCRSFYALKITLPNNYTSAVIGEGGCVVPDDVSVSFVTRTRPSQ